MSREEGRHLIEVHVAGICFRETEKNIEVLHDMLCFLS